MSHNFKTPLKNGYDQMKKEQSFLIYQTYKHRLNITSKKTDASLLYFGCATGEVMVEIALWLPSNFKRIVGIDVLSSVINRTKATYEHNSPRITFKQMDFLDPELTLSEHDMYDYILSFWSMRWLDDIRKTTKLFFNSLNTNGYGILVIETTELFDVIMKMASQPYWEHHLRDVAKMIAPYQFNEYSKIQEKIVPYFNKAALQCEYKMLSKKDTYNNFDDLVGSLKTAYSFGRIIPPPFQNQFYRDMILTMIEFNMISKELNNDTAKIHGHNHIFIIHKTIQLESLE